MGRTVFIDLSAKIEEWMADTVVAMSNGNEVYLILPSQVKRKARDYLKEVNTKPRKEAVHIYRLLAILVFLIVKDEISDIEKIVIDNDYPGDEPAGKIKNELVPLLKRLRPEMAGKDISFQQVKGKKADRLAREVFLAKERSGRLLTLQEIKEVWGK